MSSYNAVINRVIASIRQGKQMPLPLNFESIVTALLGTFKY